MTTKNISEQIKLLEQKYYSMYNEYKEEQIKTLDYDYLYKSKNKTNIKNSSKLNVLSNKIIQLRKKLFLNENL